MTHDYFRPSITQVVEAVSEEFRVGPKQIQSFEKSKSANRAKSAIAMIAHDFNYSTMAIGRALSRDHTTISSNILAAQTLMNSDALFRVQVAEVKKRVHGEQQKKKPPAPTVSELQKLETVKGKIVKLRNEHGWSLKLLCKYFGLSQQVVAPVIGVFLVER